MNELPSGQLDPDRSSPFHKVANKIVFHHEATLAVKYDKLGRLEDKKGDIEKAKDAYWTAEEIRQWLKTQ